MKNRGFWQIIACVLPLLLIFALRSYGVKSNVLLYSLLILCCGSHLFILRGIQGRYKKDDINKKEKKELR